MSFGQLDDLASGLPVLSQHPRYWSIYTYVIKRFWDLGVTPQTNQALGRFLKPREIVFAGASILCREHPELPGILGRNALAPYLRQARDDVELDLPYLDQALGGYGQVYRGAMADLGLVLRAEFNPAARVDAPMGDIGISLAEAFQAAIAGTTYARQYADQTSGSIPVGVIRELGEASCFHRLAEGGPERDILLRVLLGAVQAGHPAHRNRAATVRMFLDVARSTDGTRVDEDRFRRLLYWRSIPGETSWIPHPSVEPTWHRWWLARHRELVVAALNALFVHMVRWGLGRGGVMRDLSVAEYWMETSNLATPAELGLGRSLLSATPFRLAIDACDAVVREGGWPMKPVAGAVQEDVLAEAAARGTAAEAPAIAFIALLLTLRRLEAFLRATETTIASWTALTDGGDDRVSTSSLVSWVARRYDAGGSVADALADLTRLYVIRQHLRIARGKLPDDTFRFHQDAGYLRFVDQGDREGLNPISIRFNAVASALAELGLVAAPFGNPEHALTPLGEELVGG